MNLFDWFFPDVAAAHHLRSISRHHTAFTDAAETVRIGEVRQSATTEALKMRIDELEKDMGFLVLMLSGLVSALEEKGQLTRDDVKKELSELDGIDGLRDGELSIRVLKQYLHDAGQ